MKRHKFNIYPNANKADFKALMDDLRSNGYDPTLPITIYQGDIIDGCNRQRACEDLGITPIYTEFHGNDDEALAFIMRTNNRRNLTDSQRAMVAAKWAGLKRGGIEGNQNASKTNPPIGGFVSNPQSATKTRDEAGKLFDVGTSSIDRAKKVMKDAPELVEKIESGEMSVNAAYVTTKKPTEPVAETEPLVVDGTQGEDTQKNQRIPKFIPDDADRLWLLAKQDLNKILPTDKSRERVLKEIVKYAQARIETNK